MVYLMVLLATPQAMKTALFILFDTCPVAWAPYTSNPSLSSVSPVHCMATIRQFLLSHLAVGF